MTLISLLQNSSRRKTAWLLLAALGIFAAGRASLGQTSALPTPVSAVIRADFPYETNPASSAKQNVAPAARTFSKTSVPSPALQWKDTAPPASKGTVVPLPEYPVKADKYRPLGGRFDSIDSSLRREESLVIPNRADLFLNGEKTTGYLQKFLISFGPETAQKRARDAARRIDVLEMRRIVQLGLAGAPPEEKQRLKDDQAALKELGTHQLDQSSFVDSRTKNP